jgi:hypothetical protein
MTLHQETQKRAAGFIGSLGEIQSANYPEGVALHSPGSRSAPWVGVRDKSIDPERVAQTATNQGLYNPFRVARKRGLPTQGALRDPGLWSRTLSGFLPVSSPSNEGTVDGSAGASPSHRPRRGWLLWPVLVLLGFLLFVHLGCHGDEDNELFHGFGTGIGIGCDRNCTLDRN